MLERNIDPLNNLTDTQIKQYSDKFEINFSKTYKIYHKERGDWLILFNQW